MIARLSGAGEEFAGLWAGGDVAPHGTHMKVIRHASVGEVRLVSTSLVVGVAPETRIVVYTPADEESRRLTAVLRTVHDPVLGGPAHRRPASEAVAELERTGGRKAKAKAKEGRKGEGSEAASSLR
ncbi:hypothetical protein [Streptomyces sp. YGL11-2]|uniref:MmyB family transcriptional regulator n=1 Tax=Streptomyces sp. YGL11-2 TaxID=3414028 RepID=UPI003CF31091